MKHLQDLISFAHKTRIIKFITRASNNDLVKDKDTVASHSWRASLLGVLLAPYLSEKNLDAQKVVNILVIHDLVEIETKEVEGLGNRDREAKKKREFEVAKKMFVDYEGNWKEYVQSLLAEFLAQVTLEAKIAKAIENYERCMSLKRFDL